MRDLRYDERTARVAQRVEREWRDALLRDAWGIYIEDRHAKRSQRHYLDHQRMAEAGGLQGSDWQAHDFAGVLAR